MASIKDILITMDTLREENKYLIEKLKWKSELLEQKTQALYSMIQQSQDALNKLPQGMIE